MTQISSDVSSPPASKSSWWHPLPIALGITCVTTPFEVTKKRMQTGLKFSLDPRVLYRGGGSFFMSLAPTTWTQLGLKKIFDTYAPVHATETHQALYTHTTTVLAAASGGLFSCAVENMILAQHTHNIGPKSAFEMLWKAKGIRGLYSALPNLMAREAVFGYSMLLGGAKVGNYLSAYTNNEQIKPYLNYAGQIAVGITGATLSQSFDALATQKQRLLHIQMGAAPENHISRKFGIKPDLTLPQRLATTSLRQAGLFGISKTAPTPSNLQLMKELPFKECFSGLVPRWGLFTGALLTSIAIKNYLESSDSSADSNHQQPLNIKRG